jgi:Lipase (class 3)
MAQGTFDLWQQVFTFTLMSSADDRLTGTGPELAQHLAESIRSRLLDPGLRKLIGDSWELAWGPGIFQSPKSSAADNAIFLVRDTVDGVYVIAIAGTNPSSSFDIIEDLAIQHPLAWPYGGAPTGTLIAPGTRDGVNALLSLESGGLTLLSYLQNVDAASSSSSTLIFTGHSLGGALAPALALALAQQGFNPGAWQAVYVYPTAGPTAGNSAFATFFSQTFPQPAAGPQPWQVWNADLANSLDVVPQAWGEQTLASIPNLYAPSITASPEIKKAVALAEGFAREGKYTRIGTANDLTGSTVQGSGGTTQDFETEAFYQHIYAYVLLLEVEALLTLRVAGKPLFNIPNPYATSGTGPLAMPAAAMG